ncbi:MAG TPA: hypothetical protein PLO78_04825 [Candidatus Omnitrophota bacterium]|nr:hypothetical protein [Candidatus Omnitrophota bacterium]
MKEKEDYSKPFLSFLVLFYFFVDNVNMWTTARPIPKPVALPATSASFPQIRSVARTCWQTQKGQQI